ncbi:transcriptional Coactivator p15-domain-containing protein [Kalaharituber pfeilii]|nr:transcriptional Coactivator p15-domain-containing protein [Kalaharituber pfeilii]
MATSAAARTLARASPIARGSHSGPHACMIHGGVAVLSNAGAKAVSILQVPRGTASSHGAISSLCRHGASSLAHLVPHAAPRLPQTPISNRDCLFNTTLHASQSKRPSPPLLSIAGIAHTQRHSFSIMPPFKRLATEARPHAEPASKRNKTDDDVFTKKWKDEEGNTFWELGGRNRRITISEYKGKLLVNIREHYEKEGKVLPGKKGISLSIEQFNAMMSVLPQVHTELSKKSGEKIIKPNFSGVAEDDEEEEEEEDEEDEEEDEEDEDDDEEDDEEEEEEEEEEERPRKNLQKKTSSKQKN